MGLSLGLGGKPISVNIAASQNKDKGDGADLSYTQTTVTAGNTAQLNSGTDTTLKGASVTARQIIADVGTAGTAGNTGSGKPGKLTLESLQDTSTYVETGSSSGFSAGFSPSGVPLSGSLSAGRTKINSDYQSVTDQTGLKAGDGGFQVHVAGNTDLKGAVIASTDKAVQDGKNTFTTGSSLTLTDLQNQAHYEGSSNNLTVGIGTNNTGALTSQGSSAGFGEASGNASSTTRAGISGIAGPSTSSGQAGGVRTGDSANGIGQIFNANDVKKDLNAQVAITQQFGQEAPKAVATYADSQIAELDKQLKDAPEDQKAALKAEKEKWAEGGTYRVALHTLRGALVGGMEGALGAGATAEAAPYLVRPEQRPTQCFD